MNGTFRSAARRRPRVDLPPPRSPISAMRPLRVALDGPELRQQQLARARKFRRRQAVDELGQQQVLDRLVRPLVDQLGGRHAHGVGDPAQQHDRAVAGAGLELGEVAFRHLGVARQHLARHAAPAAHGAHPLAQPLEEGVDLALRGLCPLRHGNLSRCIIMHAPKVCTGLWVPLPPRAKRAVGRGQGWGAL